MKKSFLILLIVFVVVSGVGLIGFYFYLRPINITNVEYKIEDKKIYATIEISKNVLDPICSIEGLEIKTKDYKCTFEIPNEKTMIKVTSPFYEIEYSLVPNVNQIVDFTLKETNIYLAKTERKEILFSIDKLGEPRENIQLVSSDESIVATDQNFISGVSPGTCTVIVMAGSVKKEINVTVTDLITLPVYNEKKPKLPCGIYNAEQNRLLDDILQYKIQNAGYQTRAGVVTALRFLTLEFPYHISYFYENGRLNNNTGGNYVDGEGRFYHKGLYLYKNKYSELVKTKYGPAIWGCPLTNWQDEAGFIPGVKYPNGLDCSGFISWAFLNGGFDVGDTGAGDNTWRDDDLSDLGPHVPITKDVLTNGKLKAGDIIATNGHIAMIGGIKDNVIYVGESTTYYKGVVMHAYTIDELLSTDLLTYVIYMDHYYKEDGNYTDYWENN